MITDAILKIFRKDPTIKRHLLKTLSWRLVGSVDTALLGWFITGRPSVGIKIGGMELLTKMLLYFMHERAWHRIKFGIPSRTDKATQMQAAIAPHLFPQTGKVNRQQKEALNGSPAFTIWLTGLSGSGKSSIAAELDGWFYRASLRSYVIDGDNTRLGINSDLGFSREDREENIRRVAQVCRLFNEAGIIAIASFISPFEAGRANARAIIGPACFVETFTDASLDTCKARDVKGLYKLAEQGKIKDFTGVNSPYETPATPDIHLHTGSASIAGCIDEVIRLLRERGYVRAAG